MNNYAVFNAKRNFSQPERFMPERWLDDARKEVGSEDKLDVVQPFSVGPRNCIGQHLAIAEIKLVLARMLWEFDMELDDETSESWPDQKAWMSWQQKPLYVRLRARENT